MYKKNWKKINWKKKESVPKNPLVKSCGSLIRTSFICIFISLFVILSYWTISWNTLKINSVALLLYTNLSTIKILIFTLALETTILKVTNLVHVARSNLSRLFLRHCYWPYLYFVARYHQQIIRWAPLTLNVTFRVARHFSPIFLYNFICTCGFLYLVTPVLAWEWLLRIISSALLHLSKHYKVAESFLVKKVRKHSTDDMKLKAVKCSITFGSFWVFLVELISKDDVCFCARSAEAAAVGAAELLVIETGLLNSERNRVLQGTFESKALIEESDWIRGNDLMLDPFDTISIPGGNQAGLYKYMVTIKPDVVRGNVQQAYLDNLIQVFQRTEGMNTSLRNNVYLKEKIFLCIEEVIEATKHPDHVWKGDKAREILTRFEEHRAPHKYICEDGVTSGFSPQKSHEHGYESLGCIRSLAASLIVWELNYDPKNHNNNSSRGYGVWGFNESILHTSVAMAAEIDKDRIFLSNCLGWITSPGGEPKVDVLSRELYWEGIRDMLNKNLNESNSFHRYSSVSPNNPFLVEFLKMDSDLIHLKRAILEQREGNLGQLSFIAESSGWYGWEGKTSTPVQTFLKKVSNLESFLKGINYTKNCNQNSWEKVWLPSTEPDKRMLGELKVLSGKRHNCQRLSDIVFADLSESLYKTQVERVKFCQGVLNKVNEPTIVISKIMGGLQTVAKLELRGDLRESSCNVFQGVNKISSADYDILKKYCILEDVTFKNYYAIGVNPGYFDITKMGNHKNHRFDSW